MANLSIIAAFLAGLLGGAHCLGLCGSIVGIFTAQLPKPSPQSSPASVRGDERLSLRERIGFNAGARWSFHLAFNGGRLFSYTVSGALVGGLGLAGILWRDIAPLQHLLFALSSMMLIALGLYLADLWSLVRRIERLGGMMWQHIMPLARGLFPITTPIRAFMLGTLWGWLPCGLLYSVLVTALLSGNAQSGALIMLAFGLGTLPNLLAAGLFRENIRYWTQSPHVQKTAGMLVAGFGVYGLIKVSYTVYTYGWMASCHTPA